ncbi:MAG TPA: 30S ribosomal protein S9 [Candidatus Saccharimonadales bacterium]|nr:30S ribosomal protein S9 [Candidatus Saccharimonadales bacterium]
MATSKNEYFYGLGRRKSSTARARLMGGKGTITVNDKKAEEYFCGNEAYIAELIQPLQLLGREKDFDISLKVDGGGLAGQVDASKLAISKALSGMNDDLRGTLKKAGLLMRDPREKEPKKYGLRSARKREQFSKR